MHTNFKFDFSQSAVPIWDIQPVASVPAMPLSGAGFYYRTVDESGGFIIPAVATKSHHEEIIDKHRIDSIIGSYRDFWNNRLNDQIM